jgi:hypothetical protein
MVLFRTLTVKKADTMKKLLLSLTTIAALISGYVQAALIMTIEDLDTAISEVFTDIDIGIPGAIVNNTPGLLGVDSTESSLLGDYWVGSIQIAASNYASTDELAQFISASINLNSTSALGENLVVNIAATDYFNPTGIGTFETIINASTLVDTSYDATVQVAGTPLLTEIDVTDTNTYSATASIPVPTPFQITHAFRLSSDAEGADLSFDISTRALPTPSPASLALMGLGLVGLGMTRKLSK